MTLAEYLTLDPAMTPAAFARTIDGASEGAVRLWVTHERMPRPEQMKLIFDATGGLVTPNDFHGLGYMIPFAPGKRPTPKGK